MFRKSERHLKSLLRKLRISLYKPRFRRVDTCYITCAGHNDGIGAQVQAIWSTMLLAKEMGLTYVHTPLSKVAHKPDGVANWESAWEQFFNLGSGELKIDEVAGSPKIIHLEPQRAWRVKRRPNTLYTVLHCHRFADAVPDRYKTIQELNRRKYEETSKPRPLKVAPSKLSVAIHVRRGDVQSVQNGERFTQDAFVLNAICQIREATRRLGKRVEFHLYSEGDQSDFESYADEIVTLHLNESVFETFHQLRTADVLVMAKSSLSYVAALYSDGVKLYEPFWCNPMREWVRLSSQGLADSRKLQTALARLCQGENARALERSVSDGQLSTAARGGESCTTVA